MRGRRPANSPLLFDFSRVTNIDVSAVKALFYLTERIYDRNAKLYLSGIGSCKNRFIYEMLSELEVVGLVGEEHVFPTFVLALEEIEDELLGRILPDYSRHTFHFQDFTALRKLSRKELAIVEHVLTERSFRTGEVLIREGEVVDRLYLVRQGRLKIWRSPIFIVSLGPGAIAGFGSLYDEEVVTDVSLKADTDGAVYVIRREQLRRLAQDYPRIYTHFQQEVLRYLVDRLNLVNSELALLEER